MSFIKLLFAGAIGTSTYRTLANQASVSQMAELSVEAKSGIEMLSESFLQSSAEAEMKLIEVPITNNETLSLAKKTITNKEKQTKNKTLAQIVKKDEENKEDVKEQKKDESKQEEGKKENSNPKEWIQRTEGQKKVKISIMGDSLTVGLCQAQGKFQSVMENPEPYTSWANFLTDYIIQNYGLNEFEVGNYAMSGRSLSRLYKLPIWTGEKFDDFMNSNADVFLIMIGSNDRFTEFYNNDGISFPEPSSYNKTVIWKNETAVNEWVDTYVELATKLRALPQKPQVFVINPPPADERCKNKILTATEANWFHMDQSLVGQVVSEKPGCDELMRSLNEARTPVYSKIKEKLGLDDNHLIDGFNLFGGVKRGHDEFYCDGNHLNTAGSSLLAVEVYKALRKAKVLPTNYKLDFI